MQGGAGECLERWLVPGGTVMAYWAHGKIHLPAFKGQRAWQTHVGRGAQRGEEAEVPAVWGISQGVANRGEPVDSV